MGKYGERDDGLGVRGCGRDGFGGRDQEVNQNGVDALVLFWVGFRDDIVLEFVLGGVGWLGYSVP